MIVTTIKGFTNVLGEPKDWDSAANGDVRGLPVKAEKYGASVSLTSAWTPTTDELAALLAGAPIHLRVIGGHPPVSLYVDGVPENLETDFSESDARRVLMLAKVVQLCRLQFARYADLHSAKQTAGGDEKAETNRQLAKICSNALEGIPPSHQPPASDGYAEAFYELAKMMDLVARTTPPAEVWQTEMRPRLVAALGSRDGNFQARVGPWLLACFGEEIAADREERNHRFLEEALELVQSNGCTASEAHQLVDYVFGRPVGEPAQEVGGVMVTLAALCRAIDIDMHAAGEVELARIWTKVEAIRAKQAAKPKHSPLPEAVATARPSDEELDEHLPDSLQAERRCGMRRSAWLDGWYVPWSPRNDNENAEGPWSHWVELANGILAADLKARRALAPSGASAA